jgi:NADH-quinone oxidoreductase subunit F
MCGHMWNAYCAFAPGGVSPIESLLAHFEQEVMAHIEQGGCPFKNQGGR